jgi:hypothetical protein
MLDSRYFHFALATLNSSPDPHSPATQVGLPIGRSNFVSSYDAAPRTRGRSGHSAYCTGYLVLRVFFTKDEPCVWPKIHCNGFVTIGCWILSASQFLRKKI